MASVTQVRVESVTPVQLVERVRRGRIRLPSFQRSYRWTPSDVEGLFDSVLKRYPVGNLLFWERPADAGRVTLGSLTVDVPAAPLARWVVDGQQRITSLVGALTATENTSDPRFQVYVDLSTRRFRATARQPGARWLPLRVAGSNQELLGWQRARWGELGEDEFAVADEVASSLREYPIPSYVVEADDERELRVVFDRMNNAGRRLTRDEVFDALHGMQDNAEPGDLRGVVDAVAATGFGRIDEAEVRRSLLALRAPNVFRDVHNEFTDDADRRAAFALTERVLLEVVEILRDDISVPHAKLLPYPSVLPLLASMVHYTGRPTGRALVLVRRWFWRGAAAGANPAGSPPGVRRTLRALAETNRSVDAAQILLTALPRGADRWRGPDLGQMASNRALARVNLLGLFGLEPCELRHFAMDPMPAPELVPAELMEATAHPLIPLLPAEQAGGAGGTLANRLLHPSLPTGSPSVVRLLLDSSEEVRASHAVDDAVAEHLSAGQWAEALSRRTQLVGRQIEEFVDDRAEWGALDRPTAAEMMDSA